MDLAKKIVHPFEGEWSLKENHIRSIEALRGDPSQLIKKRLKSLQWLRSIAKEQMPFQERVNKRAAWTAAKLGLKIQTETMRYLQEHLKLEDDLVPDICLDGLGILGKASESPFFVPFEVRPTMKMGTFLATLESRSIEMIRRVETMGRSASVELSTAIWRKTLKEVEGGTMGPPLSLEDVRRIYGNDFQVVPSFGLQQGFSEDGSPKYRRIDDHSASGGNQVAHRLQKVPMAMADYVGVLTRAVGKLGSGVHFSTEDMKGAYRQVPLHPSDVRYAITAVYCPEKDSAFLFEMYGQPFGAGHSVPNFCRVSEWIARCAQKLFLSTLDHFFDDFFMVEPPQVIESSCFCLKELFSILGFSLDPEKSQPPSSVCSILGVVFSSEALHSERKFHVSPKPSRVRNLRSILDSVLIEDSLTPSQAASIVGKFGFMCSTLFGKVGRCCTGALRHRQYSHSYVRSLTTEMRQSISLMSLFLELCPHREISLSNKASLIVYTDASDVPGRNPQHVLGCVLISAHKTYHTHAEVPADVISMWMPRHNHMSQLELLAAPLAWHTWEDLLRDTPSLLFIDNNGAAANLVKGYSPQLDSSSIVGHFWLLASSMKSSIYIDRVESKPNPADGPSRLDSSWHVSAVWPTA